MEPEEWSQWQSEFRGQIRALRHWLKSMEMRLPPLDPTVFRHMGDLIKFGLICNPFGISLIHPYITFCEHTKSIRFTIEQGTLNKMENYMPSPQSST
ncbi:hypothetical protein MHYP_G00025980 [Metynnis hypsauchen]